MSHFLETVAQSSAERPSVKTEDRMIAEVGVILNKWHQSWPGGAGKPGVDKLVSRLRQQGFGTQGPTKEQTAALDVCDTVGQVLRALAPSSEGDHQSLSEHWNNFDFGGDLGHIRRVLYAIVSFPRERSTSRSRALVVGCSPSSAHRQQGKTGVTRKTRSNATSPEKGKHVVDLCESFSIESPNTRDAIYIFADGKKTMKQIRWLLRNPTQLYKIYCLAYVQDYRVGETLFKQYLRDAAWLKVRAETDCNCLICFNTEECFRVWWRIMVRVHTPPNSQRIQLKATKASKRVRKLPPVLTPDILEDINSIPVNLRPVVGMAVPDPEAKEEEEEAEYCTDPDCLFSPIRNFNSDGPRTTPSMYDLLKFVFCEGFYDGLNRKCHRAECDDCPFRHGCAAESEPTPPGSPFPRCPLEHSDRHWVKFDCMESRTQPGQSGQVCFPAD
jgi:hypothetical protein